MPFLLDSQDCELLLAFEKGPTIESMSQTLGKDPSVISRQLKGLSLKFPVLEKRQNRWHLTDLGKKINRWSEEAMFAQKQLMQHKQTLKIATTREFASRILIPQTRSLVGNDDMSVSIISSDGGTEKLLLSGEADIGIDCGRPYDPEISFKQMARETMLCVASPKFLQKNGVKSFDQMLEHEHLRFVRTSSAILDLEVKASKYYGSFSDVSTLREACKLGYGWAILPYYTIEQELKNKQLTAINGPAIREEKFGVWWPRSRHSVLPWVQKTCLWLKSQESKLLHPHN